MIAIDTNVLVRIAVNDDAAQVEIARRLIEDNEIFIPRTVILETEWVLRSLYGKPRRSIGHFFQALLDTSMTTVEDSHLIETALEWYRDGADFADALHLAASGDRAFHTFDRDFCKTSRERGATTTVRILDSTV